MTLDEYIDSEDSNIFWRLSDGERQNLLDEAIERLVDCGGSPRALGPEHRKRWNIRKRLALVQQRRLRAALDWWREQSTIAIEQLPDAIFVENENRDACLVSKLAAIGLGQLVLEDTKEDIGPCDS